VFFLRNEQGCLLGRPEILQLGILQRPSVQEIRQSPEDRFAAIFEGMGRTAEPYKIELRENAKPYAVSCPRRISIPLRAKTKEKLDQMEADQLIRRIDKATEWCAPIVVLPKSDGDIRFCVDYTQLNPYVIRPRLQLPAVDECLADVGNNTVFSVLDAKQGYWQIPLHKKSQELTTFLTPFGRYCWNRLPMGLSSSGEFYQRRMSTLLAGIPGTTVYLDDVLVVGRSVQEHDERLSLVLERLYQGGIRLNKAKCRIRAPEVKFLGHLISARGIAPDPAKIAAITDLPTPCDVTAVRSLLGTANQLLKFVPHLSTVTQPLRELLIKDNQWTWGKPQEMAFQQIKDLLVSPRCLASFDPKKETRVSADSSSYGLGALLEQRQADTEWRPVYYASRTLSDTEKRYAQVEKEALASTWACEKFNRYLEGLEDFELRTDHRPLVSILGSKAIGDLTPRLQRFRMRLRCYRYHVTYVPGKYLYAADHLSRSPHSGELSSEQDVLDDESVNYSINAILDDLPMSDCRLQEIRDLQAADKTTQEVIRYVQNGWPPREDLSADVRPFTQYEADLHIVRGLLALNGLLYLPPPIRSTIIERLHQGHLGVEKCRQRARDSVWYPGISAAIKSYISRCAACVERRPPPTEPHADTDRASRPGQIACSDLFSYGGRDYIVVVDEFSQYPEVIHLTSTTSRAVILTLKSILARSGVPEIFRSDNGPQFSSEDFRHFADEWGFTHTTSSPRFPRSNGQAEAAVKVAKQLLASDDPFLSLLNYRNTPTADGASPAQRFMGRRLRGTVPVLPDQLTPRWPDLTKCVQQRTARLEKNAKNFDHRHRVRSLRPLYPGEDVWIVDLQSYGSVVQRRPEPRSYDVQANGKTYRRNRGHLVPTTSRTASEWTKPLTEDEYVETDDFPRHTRDDPPSIGPQQAELRSPSPEESQQQPVPASMQNESPARIPRSPRQPELASPQPQRDGYTTRAGRHVRAPPRFRDYVVS